MILTAVNIVMLLVLLTTALIMLLTRNLFTAVMLTGLYSLSSALLYVFFDAVDVAFTEAAVGAGVSTVLMLAAMALTDKQSIGPRRHKLLGGLAVLFVGGMLIYVSYDFAPYGDANNVVHQHVAKGYLTGKIGDQNVGDLGIPNTVTTVLSSYRGYDTLGETVVVFTAGLGVLLLLIGSTRRPKRERKRELTSDMHHQLIPRVNTKIVLPLIFLFALYVQFHGDFGPGGGFQAGVIFASGVILYTIIFGLSQMRTVFGQRRLEWFGAVGVLLYVGTGWACVFLGGQFLEYGAIAGYIQGTEGGDLHDLEHGQHMGILLIEAGVGLTVAVTLTAIFAAFMGRGLRGKSAKQHRGHSR